MCGINGLLRLDPRARLETEELVATRDALARRGPDGSGAWCSPSGRVALGHRRLSIIDLNDRARQPMSWPAPSPRYQLIFNGEIYNFRALRSELQRAGVEFRTESDTEVMLALYEREGAAMLGRLRGMFALAIWDELEGTLLVARDRFGIKPLYYAGGTDGVLRFASQVKALEVVPAVGKDLDVHALAGFLIWGSVPEPLTIRRAIRCLPAGHFLLLRADEPALAEPRALSQFPVDAAIPAEPGAAIEDSVVAHLVSDVPVGVFLSAGLDSSVITALACRHLGRPPRTVTVSFDVLRGTPLDEAPQAAATARALGTDHVEHRVGRADFAALWDGALSAMDQPSIDGFNSYLVSAAAKAAGLKVVLSGLGGDELFGSYRTFEKVPATLRWARRLAAIPAISMPSWERWARRSGRPKAIGLLRHGRSLAGSYLLRRAVFLPEELPRLLDQLVGEGAAAEALAERDPLALAAGALAATETELRTAGRHLDAWTAVQGMETRIYLRNQLLRDADWASMAHSVELRVPFVDDWLHRRLLDNGFEPGRSRGKAPLFRRIAPELPAELFQRRKSGFYIPMAEWASAAPRPMRASRRGSGSRRLALEVLAGFGLPGAVQG